MKRKQSILVALLVLSLCGCAQKIIHPNQINAFDGQAYDTLITAQAAINQAKLSINQFPQFKAELNTVIDLYNMAQESYKAYHVLNPPSAKDTTALNDEITLLMTKLTVLLKDLGVKI